MTAERFPRHVDIGRHGQDLNGELIWVRDGHRFRAVIRRNAYDHQSYARVDILGGDGWTPLATRSIADLEVAAYTYATVDNGDDFTWRQAMTRDLRALIDTAQEIMR